LLDYNRARQLLDYNRVVHCFQQERGMLGKKYHFFVLLVRAPVVIDFIEFFFQFLNSTGCFLDFSI
jgi:hypothetical protein